MAYCRECGCELGDGAKFCPECGTPVTRPQPVDLAEHDTHDNGLEPTVSMPSPPADVTHLGEAPDISGTSVLGDDSRATGSSGAALDETEVAPTHVRWHASRESYDSSFETQRREGSARRGGQSDGRKLPPLPMALSALFVGALAGTLIFRVAPQFLMPPSRDTQDSEMVTEEVRETTAEGSAQTDSPGGKPEPAAEDRPDDESACEDVATPDAKTESEPVREEQPAPDAQAEIAADSVASIDPPTIGEFTWFSDDLMNGNVPASIARITDINAIMGGWKAYIYTYPLTDNPDSHPTEELLNVYIDAGQEGIALDFDWYQTLLGDGTVSENTQPSTEYSGVWRDGTLEAYGTGSVNLTDFWEENGHQYAIGRIVWPDAMDATIALVRP